MKPTTKKKTENPYLPKQYKVLDFYRESPDTFTLTVSIGIRHDPGQFVQVSLPGIGEAPISICSYSGKHLKMNIREVGNVTNHLASLRKGDAIYMRGPYGKGYPMHEFKGKNLLIIGGGCGVAPLKGIIDYVEQHRKDYADVALFLGYRSPDDIIFKRELLEWEKTYHLKVTVDKEPPGQSCYNATQGFITDAIKQTTLNTENSVVFICGPPVMMKNTIALLKDKGFTSAQIYISAERLMYCAVGVCCHCMIRGKYTCKDGPVFRYDEIEGFTND